MAHGDRARSVAARLIKQGKIMRANTAGVLSVVEFLEGGRCHASDPGNLDEVGGTRRPSQGENQKLTYTHHASARPKFQVPPPEARA
jgi:hypothetical protein